MPATKNWKRRKIKLFHQTLWRIAFYQLWNLTFSSFATLFIYKKGRAMSTQWLLIMQSYLCLWTCLKHHFLMTFTKKIQLRFINDIFFIWTDGENSLKEFLVFCQKYSETKNMKSVIKFEISQSIKTINFLNISITLNQQILSATVFSKPKDAHINLNPKSCYPEHLIRDIFKRFFFRNAIKWSDVLEKTCNICCKIFKVCMTILWHCEVKG